jgi:hypothetical protein
VAGSSEQYTKPLNSITGREYSERWSKRVLMHLASYPWGKYRPTCNDSDKEARLLLKTTTAYINILHYTVNREMQSRKQTGNTRMEGRIHQA